MELHVVDERFAYAVGGCGRQDAHADEFRQRVLSSRPVTVAKLAYYDALSPQKTRLALAVALHKPKSRTLGILLEVAAARKTEVLLTADERVHEILDARHRRLAGY